MGKIIIMTDSASDISEKEEKELGIKILSPDEFFRMAGESA